MSTGRSYSYAPVLALIFAWVAGNEGKLRVAHAFLPCTQRLMVHSSYHSSVWGDLRLREHNQDELETQKLQAELDKIVEEPKMFGSFDANNFDDSALAVPPFTAWAVAAASLWWTYYLFDVGINGFPDPS